MDREGRAQEIYLISFRIGDEVYTIDVKKVKEIIKPCKITPIPKAPPFVEGVISLRGLVIPIIDMRKRFGLPPGTSPVARIMIVQVDKRIVGILVDEVKRIVKLSQESIQPPPEVARGIGPEFLKGVWEDREGIILLLDIDRILSSTEKVLLEGSFKDNKKDKKTVRGTR